MKEIDEDLKPLWQQMLSGEIYDAPDPRLIAMLEETRERIFDFNSLRPSQKEEQLAILHELLGACGKNLTLNQPFHCDYGRNIFLGDNVLINYNLTVLDEATVTVGNNVYIGPNVSIYTPCHPLDAEQRCSGIQWAKAVTIGNNVWVGGGATILPGVTIGDNAVIAAGAVVSRDVPASTLVAGNPARVIKSI